MILSWCLFILALTSSTTLSTNPGVEVRLTNKGLDYGRQLGIAYVQQELRNVKIPDFSGTERVVVGKVKYCLSKIHVVNVGLPRSAIDLVPGSGVKLTIGDAFISMQGNWKIKYLVLKDSGSFDLNVNGLTITTSIAVRSDETGRPTVSVTSCAASVGSAKIKFHGGASWLYDLFTRFIDKALRDALQKQICPLVTKAVEALVPQLKTLNVLAKVDKYAEIEYSMVSSPAVSTSSIDLSLKGEFYNIGKHQEPPFSPTALSLPPQTDNMLYIALSAFTFNSAAFVYNNAKVLSIYITDDMVPKSSPFRLNTKTFGALIPQIAKQFPGLMIKLLLKTEENPQINFKPKNATLQTNATITAYAIQLNGTLSPLFVLNVESSISTQVFVVGMKIAGSLSLNKMKLSLGTSYVGQFEVSTIDHIFQMVLKVVAIPIANVYLAEGYPLPALGKMQFVNPQLQILKDSILLSTDVQFTG
ncbi:bactericidal permeability-increasing protein [Austrofundulus limnaeus]|uniref:Bactericidal permeability-increasing protein n=1 Tax=Austrofundulus limnaeus TaxID=52670 RepID=A0A2I4CM30_AUSLI|nr:PREDICTED: bactericidal permeability-increasing protein-like [Austrofundulus limnaeus]